MNKLKTKSLYSLVAIFLIIIACVWHDVNTHRYRSPERVIQHDVISYYSYLPAIFIEKDYTMSFVETDKKYQQYYWPIEAPNGSLVVKMSMGLSMMYAPFFFLAHLAAEPLGYEANGFTIPYAVALMLGTLVYLMLGYLFLRKVLLKYFPDWVVAVTLIIIGTGTNLFWYSTQEATMSHAYSFSLFCIFLYLTERWYKKPQWHISTFLGLTFGLISLIRPTNGLIILMFLLFNITGWKDILPRLRLFLANYSRIILIILCAFIVWLPQLLYWHSLTGDWLYYSYANNEPFFFNDPKIWKVMFSFRNGWLLYTPVMIFSVIGIGLLYKMNKKYFFSILIFFIANLYVISSWWAWWYGGAFGMRPVIESYAILSIPLAAFLLWTSKRKLAAKVPLYILVVAFYCQSVFHNIQYYYGSIHYGEMTKEAYCDSFWHIRPSEKFHSLLKDNDSEAAKRGER